MPSPHANQNHVINHIAIAVPDCDAAVAWYQEVFGFRQIRPTSTTDRNEAPSASIFKIYPASLQKVKIAFLTTGNGVGFEVFEYIEPKTVVPKEGFEYNRGGFFHICVTVANPNATARLVVENGGRQIGETVTVYDEEAIYVQDPWGNVVELLSCSFEQLMSSRS